MNIMFFNSFLNRILIFKNRTSKIFLKRSFDNFFLKINNFIDLN